MSNQQLEYYLSLESDLEKCSRYVEFTASNYNAHSIEFSKIVMAASAEIDTIAKELCKLIDLNTSASNIVKYADCILAKHPNIIAIEVVIPRYNIRIKPWNNWSDSSSPNWWQSYNKINHDRANNFTEANLINAISALAGHLSLMLYYFLEKNGKQLEMSLSEGPKLLGIADLSANDDWESGGIYWGYTLP